LDPQLVTPRIPNGCGCAGSPLSLPVRRHVSGGVVRDGRASSLTPTVTRSGLGGPMPVTIAPVVTGRCRPSPDRVSEGASSDRDTGGIMTGHLAARSDQRLPPVPATPLGGAGGIDRDDRQTKLGGHGDEPGLELARRDAGDQLPEPFSAAVLLPGLLRGEVQVLDRDGRDADPFRPVQEPGDGVPELCVPCDPGCPRSGPSNHGTRASPDSHPPAAEPAHPPRSGA
jgi:hypothetical protein